jgi:DNA-directed RNA polymerase specialized sigma24 family protein
MTAETNAPEVIKLYRGISSELRSLLLRKIVNTVQVDDIAQQTFLKLR